MPRNSFPVDVNPEVMRWAVVSSGEKVEQIGGHVHINPKTIEAWMMGSQKPSLSQLERLAVYLKRPLAAFLMPKAPIEKPLPKDFRMLPEKSNQFSKGTLLAMRRARRLQTITKELDTNINVDFTPRVGTANLKESPETVAIRERESSGISLEIQRKWQTANDALNAWRQLLEDKNIMVFQMRMEVADARGFSIIDDIPYVIVLNGNDLPEARIFTLMHEYGHILLHEAGVCIPERAYQTQTNGNVERWCNDYAAAFLLPITEIHKDFAANKNDLLGNDTMQKLTKKYKVSRQMLFLQMVKLKYLSQHTYDTIVEGMKAKKKEKVKGFVPPSLKCIQQHGKKFVNLVTSNVAQGHITNNQALDYLSIKLNTLDKVMKRTEKHGKRKK